MTCLCYFKVFRAAFLGGEGTVLSGVIECFSVDLDPSLKARN